MDSTTPDPNRSTPVGGALPGLALASLVLGILGLVLSVVLVGAFVGLIGLILGGLHLARRAGGRRAAWTGVSLSVAALVASAGFLAFYATSLQRMGGGPMGMPGAGGPGGYAAWQGKMAPDMDLTLLDGTPLRLSDLRGKRVILDFWATWCGPCVMEIPHFTQLHQEISTNDLVIVGISQEDRAVLKPFVLSRQVPYAIASSAELVLPPPYSHVQAIPTTFFLDRHGQIQHVAVGYHDYATLRGHAVAEDLPAPAREPESKAESSP